MSSSRTAVMVIALGGLAMAGFYGSRAWLSPPGIAVEKILGAGGGVFVIGGRGYDANESVSLEIKNVPLTQPSGWHLGTAQAEKGRFSFRTEEFHCVQVDDAKLRDQYKQLQVIIVATGLRSGDAATAKNTAGGILVCE